MEKGLTHYIWTHTRPQQLWILLVVALSMIPYFLSFDLPKQIVNGPIQGKGFDDPSATQTFGELSFDLPWFGHVELFGGFELGRFGMLYALSGVFLLLVVINGLFKLYINTYKGRLGERLLRRIRFELVDRVLRFPPTQFKRVKGAEVASMVKDEVEPLGGFTGETGFIHEVVERALGDALKDHEIYFSGPPAMADAMQKMLVLGRKVPVEQIHFDRFY